MSTMVSKSSALFPVNYTDMSQAWGRLFGSGIREYRRKAGLSIEGAALLSGIEVSEWMAIEDGHVWQELKLPAMAAALEISFERMAKLVWLCRRAWKP